MALVVHVVSLMIPHGFAAFLAGLVTVATHFSGRADSGGGTWLLALTWFANPALWAGIYFLSRGQQCWAAASGQIAVLLALCAVHGGYGIPAYYVWVAGMLLVVYTALLVPAPAAKAVGTATEKLGRSAFAGRRPTLRLALVLTLLDGILVAAVFLLGDNTHLFKPDEFTPAKNILTGDDAKERLLRRAGHPTGRDEDAQVLPASASDFWYYEGGNFSGDITYWMFECDSREDCLKSFEYFSGLGRQALKPWVPSRYAVVMEGLDYYTKPITFPWNVRGIKNGLVYEEVSGDHRMDYYAIDLDRNRVYYHHESGGFPTEEYRPDSVDDGDKADPK